jgi:phosphomevalonate kinase
MSFSPVGVCQVHADDIAGGFDALFLLVIDTPAVLEHVQDVWETWTEMSVCPLLARQSDGGLIRVDVATVAGLQQGISAWCEKARV